MIENKASVLKKIEDIEAILSKASDDIWNHPEISFQEQYAMERQCKLLEEFGFEVQKGYGDLDTAFSGRFGSGKPVIGILGEFDGLPNLSQEASVANRKAIVEGGAGHGCGHNLLGIGSIGAAVGVKEYLEKTGMSGTVIYFGCPAEEGGSGKAFMARDGVFDELDCAISWHPGDKSQTGMLTTLANCQISYKFTGITSHAATNPDQGRSALDALELMNVGVQFLREHIIDEARIHYAITNTGGSAPNVVQGEAEVLYIIRAPRADQVQEISQRVSKVAEGAAMMTETDVEVRFMKACSNLIPSEIMTKSLYNNMQTIEHPVFTQEEIGFAKEICQTFEHGASDEAVYDSVFPLAEREVVFPGSTDVGDVSWVCPVTQAFVATMAAGTPGHSWQLVAQGKTSMAHKGMVWAAKILAGTAIDMLNDPQIIERAKEEHKKRIGEKGFVSPIPKEVKPNRG